MRHNRKNWEKWPYVFGEKRIEPICEGDQIENYAYWEKKVSIKKM